MDRYRWVENVSRGLRHVGQAGDIAKLNHNGWYTDNYQNETVQGEVYQLPARDGKPRYLPAMGDPSNADCAQFDFHSITEDKVQAARWADQIAEYYAEQEREYRAGEDAENRIEEINTEIKDLYTGFRKISREIRAACEQVQGIQVVRQLVREKWVTTKQRIHKLRLQRVKIGTEGMEY